MFNLITTLGLIVGVLLIIFRDKSTRENIFLALYFFSNVLYALVSNSFFSNEDKWIVNTFFPYSITFNFSSGAFLYLYFKYKINPYRNLKWTDLIHLVIPFLLFLNSTPFIFLRDDFKKMFIDSIATTPTQLLKFPSLFLDYKYHIWGRPILALIYVISSIVLFLKSYLRDRYKYFSLFEIRYLVILLIASLIHYYFSSASVISFSLNPQLYETNGDYARLLFIPRISFFVMLVSVLFFPQIIFQKFFPNTFAEAHLIKKNKLEFSNPQYDIENIANIVQEYLKDKPFLRPGFSLFNFSEETKIPQHQLTYFLKLTYGQNFNDFKNYHRIQHAIELLESGLAKTHTLETISLNCGFRSRTNFIDSFKKVTGKTPSDYLKS